MIHQSLKTSLFALSLAAGALFLSHSASAQTGEPGISFYPTQSWSVANVTSSSGSPGCAISSEFNNGFVIALNGSDKWVQNLGVDFRQNIFTTGQAYDVNLAVPGNFNQAFKAKATSPSALMVDLRTYGAFYNAAIKASVFDFAIQGNSFRFYLTRFGTSRASFEQCMADQTRNIETASTSQPMPSSTPEDIKANEARDFEAEIEATDLMQDTTSPASTEPPLVLTQSSERPPESEMPALSKKDMTMPEPKDMEYDLTPVEAEPVVKKMKTPEIEVTTTKMKAEADFAAMEKSRMDKQRMGDLAQKVSKLESMVTKLEDENAILEDDLRSALSESEQERLSISSENWNLERATMRFNEAERQVKRLGQQLQRERAQCGIEKQELEAMLFDPQVTNQAQLAKLADLERQLTSSDEKLENQRLRYEERIRLLEAQF